jgi:acyl-[acyl-carrier-protein]-phospholipid O-acyltransferase/long-chain-fatty-acid--[acyl-carrier-protein] ligase
MGVRNTLLSPSKYGIVPDLAGWERLAPANGLLEAWTFVGIIAGAALGPWLAHGAGDEPAWAALGLVLLALLGLGAVRAIPRQPPVRPVGVGVTGAVFRDPWLKFAFTGAFLFWVVASVVGQDFVVYAKSVLGLPEAQQSVLLALLGAGVGAGALLAGRLSRGRIETRFVPHAAFALGAFTLVAGLVRPGLPGTIALLAAMGVAGGLVIVPVDSLLQARAPQARRGAVIAMANLLVFGGMLVGFLLGGALNRVGLDAAQILVAASVPALGLALWAWLRERRLRAETGGVTPRDEARGPG